MVIEIRVKNVFVFDKQIAFSMKADMRSKKFATNVYRENNFNVLKVAGVYGQNNAGKTCLVRCIKTIKDILLNKKTAIIKNMFTDNRICELGVTFLHEGRKFSYDLKYDVDKSEYIYEKFVEIFKDSYGNEKEELWLLKDNESGSYSCICEELVSMMSIISKNNILVYLVDTSMFPKIDEMKNILSEFAAKIDIVNMNNIPINKTIELMKNKNNSQKKVVEFIKNADLYMDNFEYLDMDKVKVELDEETNMPEEKVLSIRENIMDTIRLTSTYKGVKVPSLVFDSTGTKKLAALAGYIIEALEQDRILIIDEMDSSIHFRLTRAIVSMFNNELNQKAQLICTVHDVNLMDCKKLFRKEQIWFVHKEDSGVYVYSLADFTAKDGVRDTTDVIEKYKRGILGALPDPELIRTLIDIKGTK